MHWRASSFRHGGPPASAGQAVVRVGGPMSPIQIQSRLRVWRRWAWLIICASVVVAWTTGWTEAYIVVLLCTVSGIAVWFGGHGMRHLAHHLRLRMAGHITTATIVAYREDEQSDEFRYVALVSFVTNSGEQRQLIPLTSRYERPPQLKPWPSAAREWLRALP